MKNDKSIKLRLNFLERNWKITHFALLLSFVNLMFFHFPFYGFVFNNLDYNSLGGMGLVISLVVLMFIVNAFAFYLVLFLFRFVGRLLLGLFFVANAVAVYFVNTYGVIIDESMVGNVLNTDYEEAGSFLSMKLVVYVVLLGILPAIYIVMAKILYGTLKRFSITASFTLLFILALVFANASNWLWIDKNSKTLGGLAMPWCYSVNTSLFYIHQAQKNKKEILLPDASFGDDKKSVVVLVIGESARSQNFSLYGYGKNTNPLLSKTPGVFHFSATSCATYTTAGVKCILEHAETDELYEILPNYLYRNNVEVIWRTTNWGEPPIHVKNYLRKADLMRNCQGDGCSYDEILLAGLADQIRASTKNKILVVLHTSTSHGPTYSKKYPPQFEAFKPVCNSVELGNCTHEELVNAYDNTIVYTDYILSRIIEDLKGLTEYKSAMIFVSDHGESLGEKNLYMHGMPVSIAPKEQFDIPFIVWVSEGSRLLKPNKSVSQHNVFHSVLDFLSVDSPIYDERMNIFE